MNSKEFDRKLFQAIKVYFGDDRDGWYTALMDDMAMNCTDEQWELLCNNLNMVYDSEFVKGELPPETIIPNDYCDWGHGGVQL